MNEYYPEPGKAEALARAYGKGWNEHPLATSNGTYEELRDRAERAEQEAAKFLRFWEQSEKDRVAEVERAGKAEEKADAWRDLAHRRVELWKRHAERLRQGANENAAQGVQDRRRAEKAEAERAAWWEAAKTFARAYYGANDLAQQHYDRAERAEAALNEIRELVRDHVRFPADSIVDDVRNLVSELAIRTHGEAREIHDLRDRAEKAEAKIREYEAETWIDHDGTVRPIHETRAQLSRRLYDENERAGREKARADKAEAELVGANSRADHWMDLAIAIEAEFDELKAALHKLSNCCNQETGECTGDAR
ncbi:hypothetical protein SAMN02982929_07177 [Saccharopolyspora kobensis]|uniref:Uncharacterized protein n=1 Tax=Saccharopolyspora kobensis TaxID=146035 RepID=A0A1H6ELE1_9PSEU|nr:hypothetical protein [Saccharopolyspora kobensis]SEG98668.1 hypothetical protein SAMN02982929_07177 [Saccharopolyspora kobensis]SFD24020.1 hypothetical protein SAMN05216506_103192 [Saccharopolyspora kobensis]